MKPDGTDLRQLTFDGRNTNPHAAPDGGSVVYTHQSNGANNVWRVSIEGGDASQIVEQQSSNPRVSPDGNFIACGLTTDGATKLAILPVAGGAPVKLFDVPPTYNFNNAIRWSPDGRSVSYRDWANGIWSQPVAGGKPELLKGLPAEKLYYYSWSPGGRQFAFTRGRELRDAVLITDFK